MPPTAHDEQESAAWGRQRSMDSEQMTKNIPASSGKQQKKQHPTPPAHSRAIRGIIVPAIWEIPITESLV